jgi:hypothetical protein
MVERSPRIEACPDRTLADEPLTVKASGLSIESEYVAYDSDYRVLTGKVS